MNDRNLEYDAIRTLFSDIREAVAPCFAGATPVTSGSDMHTETAKPVHDDETCPANATHEVFYVQLAEDGTAIRKWSRSPFEGARKCRVELSE